jgi:hypothetical protein
VRDYDREPIVARDYSVLFGSVIVAFITVCLILLFMYNILSIIADANLDYVKIGFKAFLITILLISLIIFFPKEITQFRGIFKFTNNNIYYQEFKNNKNPDYVEMIDECIAQNKYIKQISFCIVVELYKRYGRKHYLSSWGLFKKSSIAIPLTKLFSFMCYFLGYMLILPIKIYKLKKAKEPLSLLKKNIVIEFTNRNYFLVNIYSQKEFDELMQYFSSKNIPITNKRVFMHHWQIINPYFIDKEENWCDNTEPKEVEKARIIKKLFQGLKRNKE